MAGLYGITKASQIIDQRQIEQGCDIIDTAAKGFIRAAAEVEKCSAIMNSNALSIDNATLQSAISEVADEIKKCEEYVTNGTASIREVTQQVYRQQSAEYSGYLKAQEEEAKRKESEKTKNQ